MHVRTRVPTRVLDTAQKTLLSGLAAFLTPSNICTDLLRQAALRLQATSGAGGTTSHSLLPWGITTPSLQHSITSQPTHLSNAWFCDGSFLPESCAGGVGVVGPHLTISCRSKPASSSYFPELQALFLACTYAKADDIIYSDSRAAIASITHCSGMHHRLWVNHCHSLLTSKRLSLVWVKGHARNWGNEQADQLAKNGCGCPPQPPDLAQHRADVVFNGLLRYRPHSTWTCALVPTHVQKEIAAVSFLPLKQDKGLWPFKFLFGLISWDGFDHYTTFWKQLRSFCFLCGNVHNHSVHGFIGACAAHPLHLQWVTSWPSEVRTLVDNWWLTATPHERLLIGKVAIPNTLWSLLCTLGKRTAHRFLRIFHRNVFMDLLNVLFQLGTPPLPMQPSRRDPWVPEHWFTSAIPPQSASSYSAVRRPPRLNIFREANTIATLGKIFPPILQPQPHSSLPSTRHSPPLVLLPPSFFFRESITL